MVGGSPIFPQFAPQQFAPPQFAQQPIAPPQWPGQPAQPGWQQNPPLAAMAPGRNAPRAQAMVPMVPPIPAQAYDASGLPTGQPRVPAAPKGLRPAPSGFESKGLANAKDRTPIYRGVAPESTPLVMPSPEQLGVTGSAGATAAAMTPVSTPTPIAMPTPPPRYSEETAHQAPAVDWNATHARLRQLGVTGFHLDRTGEGFRVTCLIPASRTGQTHQIESEAGTEAAAVQFAIQRAETYAASR
ncbi:MAG: hypothetical protein U0744_21280 [Gemmataceae bacterium]